VRYFTSERDGADVVPSVLARQPANLDNVVGWPSVEPADDYTAASLLAFALAGHAGH
jgi:hypothetical protein